MCGSWGWGVKGAVPDSSFSFSTAVPLPPVDENTVPLLTILVPSRYAPVTLVVWNYNRPNCETMGWRQISVRLGDDHVPCWQGEVAKVGEGWQLFRGADCGSVHQAPGVRSRDYFQKITLPGSAGMTFTSFFILPLFTFPSLFLGSRSSTSSAELAALTTAQLARAHAGEQCPCISFSPTNTSHFQAPAPHPHEPYQAPTTRCHPDARRPCP